MPRRLTDLKSLGDAWAEKTLTDSALAALRKTQDAAARRTQRKMDEPERASYGDLPICPCGKISYPTKKAALDFRDGEHPIALRAYICPLGHPVYHLKSPRSERRGGLR